MVVMPPPLVEDAEAVDSAEGGVPEAMEMEDAAPAVPEPALESEMEARAEEDAAEEEPHRHGHLVVDTNLVRHIQMQALREQHVPVGSLIESDRRFFRWLDVWHARLYRKMDNAVRRLDTYFLYEDDAYDAELSSFILATIMRIGGRGKDGDFNTKVKFRVDLALPGLEQWLHLVVDNIGRDSLPGRDPMDMEDDTRVGLELTHEGRWSDIVGMGGGIRLRSGNLVGYGDLHARWRYDMLGGEFRILPRGFYYTDDGFGQSFALDWKRFYGKKNILKLRAMERTTEETHGVETEQSIYFAHLRHGHLRGWLFQFSLFPHGKDNQLYLDDALFSVTWRDAFYRRWIFYSITPQVDFAREDDYDPRFSIRFGLDILFGGTISSLL